MTDATRTMIELARKIAGGTRGELGATRADDSETIVRMSLAVVELSRLNEIDRARIDAADWFRAAGDVECESCKREYWRHPHVPGCEWLHRLCNGKLVKL